MQLQYLQARLTTLRKDTSKVIQVISFAIESIWENGKYLTLAFFLLSCIGGLAPILEVQAITMLVNKLTAKFSSGGALNASGDINVYLPWITLLIGALLIKHFIATAHPWMSTHLNERIGTSLKSRCYQKALSIHLLSFETADYYDKLQRAIRTIDGRLVYALHTAGSLITGFIEIVVIVATVAKVSPIYSLLLVIGMVPLAYAINKGEHEFMKVNFQHSPLQRKLLYLRDLSTGRETAAELRLFSLGGFFLSRWKELSSLIIKDLFIARKGMAGHKLKVALGIHLLIVMVIAGTVYSGLQGTVTVGLLVAVLYLLNRFEQVLGVTVGFAVNELIRFYYEFRYVPEFLHSGEEEKIKAVKQLTSKPIKMGIEFENVGFTYPGSQEPALFGINLYIRAGEKIALVGENGAGKSTLVKLMLGLYRPTEGRILVDGIDLTGLHPDSWRTKIAAVFQDFMRYELTVKENIGFGNVALLDEEKKIIKAAQKSGIHDSIEKMHKGYNTVLGKEYESAQDLSGGQWQKIAIARAYFREAELLVLDEPAAALDAKSEYEVYQHFSNMSQGKIVLLISHRLGSAKLADRVVHLEKGRVIEEGSHEQLVAADGLYAKMYQLQAEWYRMKGEEGDGID